MTMVRFRTYLASFGYWHEWPVPDDPFVALSQLKCWAEGRPWFNTDGNHYVVPFTRLPEAWSYLPARSQP
jgi:hypothetical protein